jgi:flagellar export protein FliJ
MMKRSSERLMTVLKLAQRKQQAAAKQLSARQQQQLSMIDQQRQLTEYRSEYNRSFAERAAQSYNPVTLANYQRFYANLDSVVDAQHYRVKDAEFELEQAKARWRQLYASEKNMEKLIDRKRQQEQLELDRREQKLIDDRSQATKNPYQNR